MNILVLHGPNLNLLGERPGDAPGETLAKLNRELEREAAELGVSLRLVQSNHEGALIDALHTQRAWMDGVILNPAALGPTSYALRDALASIRKPAFEVHLNDIRRGETWRRKSVLKDVCVAQIVGKGFQSYLIALARLARKELAGKPRAKRSARPRSATPAKRAPRKAQAAVAPLAPVLKAVPRPEKTLGRRPITPPPPGAPEPRKTLGRPAGATAPSRPSQVGFITRALVRQKIADRLSGKLTPAGLATWARSQWQEVQRGAPAESGQRDLLEDLLQNLLLFSLPPHQLSDDQLIELMARLDG